MQQAANVVSMNNNNVYNQTMAWLRKKANNSVKTSKNYESHVRQFLRYARNLPSGQEFEALTVEHLKFTYHELIDYQNHLVDTYKREDGTIGSTANTKMNAIKSFFKHMAIDNKNIDMSMFDAVERVKENTESYGYLTWDETEQMIELAKELPNGEMKSVFLELSSRTGIRLSALLSIEDEDVKFVDGYWHIFALDKGKKKDKKPIPDETYYRVKKLIDRPFRSGKKIFEMSATTVQDTVNELVEKMEIDKDRRITVHSLKKVGIMYELMTTGNIHIAAKHGNHSDPKITMKHYANEFSNPSVMPGIRMGYEMEDDTLDGLSKEQLLEVIRMCSDTTRLEIENKAKLLGL